VIGTVTMPGGGGETAGVFTAQSSGAASVVPAAITPVTGGVAGAAAVVPKTAASAGGAVAAPSTGVNMGVGGLLLVVTGAAVAVMALRRRRATTH
jgi:hypothetical protein